MSLTALEKTLYDLGVQGSARKAFAGNIEAFLGQYRLTPEEKKWVGDFDVGAMLGAGVNPMLAMGYWMFLHPSHSMAAYTRALNPDEAAHG